MAKNNNLGDFLAGIANKIRELLGTTDPINPQDFEDKIQTVRDDAYSQGFAEGGPTGITATAANVLAGKVFGSGGNAKSMLPLTRFQKGITTPTGNPGHLKLVFPIRIWRLELVLPQRKL